MDFYAIGERCLHHAWRVPVLKQLLSWAYARHFDRMPPNRFSGVYTNFADAEAAIPQGARVGYDHDALRGMYRQRMGKACESDYAVLFWLRDLLRADSCVFDYGGHVGVSWYGWREYLRYPEGLRWRVCDVPSIIAEGRALAAERGVQGLEFTDRIEDGADADILLLAGSLQYVDLSLPQLLERMRARPAHVLINKLPVHDSHSFVTVQSTGRAFHPYRIYRRADVIAQMGALGYRLVDDWINREQYCCIPFTRGLDVKAYSGFYFVHSGALPQG